MEKKLHYSVFVLHSVVQGYLVVQGCLVDQIVFSGSLVVLLGVVLDKMLEGVGARVLPKD